MTTGQTYTSSPFQVNRSSVIAGAALIGTGGAIALIGVIVSGSALASAWRTWVRDLEVPPSEVVRHTWDQTKAAAAAGNAAWHQHNGIQRSRA